MKMVEKNINFPEPPAAIAAGVPHTFHCPRGYLYKYIDIFVKTAVIDDDGGGDPAYAEDYHMRTLDLIELFTHADTPWEISGRMLGHLMLAEHEGHRRFTATVPGAGVTHYISSCYRLNFGDIISRMARETWIRSWALNKMDLKVTVCDDVSKLMANPGAGTVTQGTTEIFAVAKVYEVDQDAKNDLDRNLVSIKRVREDAPEDNIAAVAFAPFLGKSLNRGFMTTALLVMTVDDLARSSAILDELSIVNANVPLITRRDDWMPQHAYNLNQRLAGADGIYFFHLDQQGLHASAPMSTEKEEFHFNRSKNAPAGTTGTTYLVQTEIAPAQYTYLLKPRGLAKGVKRAPSPEASLQIQPQPYTGVELGNAGIS